MVVRNYKKHSIYLFLLKIYIKFRETSVELSFFFDRSFFFWILYIYQIYYKRLVFYFLFSLFYLILVRVFSSCIFVTRSTPLNVQYSDSSKLLRSIGRLGGYMNEFCVSKLYILILILIKINKNARY
jgi:hypothetical protein